MIPLIDCMFLLLVFFIYSLLSMTIHRGIQVNLPAAQTGQIDKRSYISISIDRDERTFLDDEEISSSALLDRLQEENQSHPDQPVFINADKTVQYQLIIDVLDKVRLAGFRKVSLQTREVVDEP
jgi:biopolymer transport protein ExbD